MVRLLLLLLIKHEYQNVLMAVLPPKNIPNIFKNKIPNKIINKIPNKISCSIATKNDNYKGKKP